MFVITKMDSVDSQLSDEMPVKEGGDNPDHLESGSGSATTLSSSIPIPAYLRDFDYNVVTRLPFNPKVQAAAGTALRKYLAHTVPYYGLGELIAMETYRQSKGEITGTEVKRKAETGSQSGHGQFKETVKVDKSGNTYGVDVDVPKDTKPESLKISRKDNVLMIEVKMEKLAEDGSSRLYQEYTKKIILPKNVDVTKLETLLSRAGVLSINVPFFPKPASVKIPIVSKL